MYIISLSCIIYTYCKLILKSPSGELIKKYCIVLYLARPTKTAMLRRLRLTLTVLLTLNAGWRVFQLLLTNLIR